MYLPAQDDETTAIARYLDVQLRAIRDAGHGLTDDQLRSTPLRSTLSLAGLLKHSMYCMAGALKGAGQDVETSVAIDDFFTSFTATEPIDVLKRDFETLRAQYVRMVEGLDLDATIDCPPMPWYGINEPTQPNMRYLAMHHIEEFARHAGHADIIREQIDGADAAALHNAVEGIPANDYVTPWAPADS